jgi:outer membrane protein TolC
MHARQATLRIRTRSARDGPFAAPVQRSARHSLPLGVPSLRPPRAVLVLPLLLLCAGLAGCAASSKTPTVQFPPAPTYPPDHQYTLDELVELSVFRNASLDVGRYEAEAAQGLVDQVKALWLPTLRYDFAATAYDNDLSYKTRLYHIAAINVPITGSFNITHNVMLTEILTTGGKRTSGLKQAKMYAALKKIDVQRQLDSVAYDVATYYQLIALTNDIDTVLEDALRRIRVFRQVSEQLTARGSLRASNLDSLEADFFVSQIEQLQIAVRAGRQQAYAAMKQAVGLQPDEPLLLRSVSLPPLVTPLERQSVIAAIAQGFLRRPETKEVNLFARIRAEQVKFAKAAWAPNVAMLGNEIDVTGVHNSILGALDGLIAGVIIDVPVYDPARRGRLREALGLEQAAAAFQRQVEQLITLEIDVTAVEAQKALATVLRAAEAKQVAAEHYDASRQAYSRELIPASGVVTALGLDALARIGYVQALFNYHNAKAKLKRVTSDREMPYGY